MLSLLHCFTSLSTCAAAHVFNMLSGITLSTNEYMITFGVLSPTGFAAVIIEKWLSATAHTSAACPTSKLCQHHSDSLDKPEACVTSRSAAAPNMMCGEMWRRILCSCSALGHGSTFKLELSSKIRTLKCNYASCVNLFHESLAYIFCGFRLVVSSLSFLLVLGSVVFTPSLGS